MSCDWFFHCATCDEDGWGRGHDLNRQCDALKALVPHFPLFAQLARAGFDVDRDSLNVYGGSVPSGLCEWVCQHDGHRILVKSEYGDIADLCSRPIRCAACGSDRLRCGLPDHHGGECAPTEGPP